MQHTVENISPVKKSIAVTIPAEEVNAALNKVVAQYRSRVNLPGFRKGKAPISMVEKRFMQDIYNDALENLINGGVSNAVRELGVEPLGGLQFSEETQPIARDKDFSFSFSFEVMPEIDVPEYENIGVEEEAVVITEEEITDVVDRLRKNMAELEPVEEQRLPQEGDVVSMDFAGTDDEGQPVPGVSGEKFQVSIGEEQVIPDFEALVRTAAPGQTVEGKVTFPQDYGHAPLAGKTVNMKITVHSLQSKKLPELDAEFAKKASGLETVEAMTDSIRESFTRNRTDMAKGKAQTKLVEDLLAKVDFPLPEGLVTHYAHNLMQDRLERMSNSGKDPAEVGEDERNALKKETDEEAAKYAKTQLFLLTVAKKEALEVSPQEMTAALRQVAMRGGVDIKQVQEHYTRNNLFGPLRDRLLADKAVEVMYAKAKGEKGTTDEEASPAE